MKFESLIKFRVHFKLLNHQHFRNCSTQLKNVETLENKNAEVKIKKIRTKPQAEMPAKELVNYFSSTDKSETLTEFPTKFLRRKRKIPEIFYNTNKDYAKIIAQHLIKDLPEDNPILEINPGVGYLTKELLNSCNNPLLLFEDSLDFSRNLKTLIEPHQDRVKLKTSDFLSIWKLVFQDRLDNGSRAQELLMDIPKKDWEQDTNIRIFANIGTLSFVKHLINSFAFQTGLLTHGRCEMYFVMPPPLFVHLTCSKNAGYLMYRSSTVLFQLLFEHEFITKFSRKDFVPWQYDAKVSPSAKLAKFNKVDYDHLYFVKIVPRKDFYLHCQSEHIQALWFFIKQHYFSRANRVIPTLERWIPLSGTRLIINNGPTNEPKNINPSINPSELPKYCEPCKFLTSNCNYEDLNIFTEFGDLSPFQALTIFNQFVRWPEYKDCPFVHSLETNMIKMDTSPEESTEELITEVQQEFDIVDDQVKELEEDEFDRK